MHPTGQHEVENSGSVNRRYAGLELILDPRGELRNVSSIKRREYTAVNVAEIQPSQFW